MELLKKRIALQLQIGNQPKVVRGIVVKADADGSDALHIQIDEPESGLGSTILIVESENLRNMQPDSEFGCEFFLSLVK